MTAWADNRDFSQETRVGAGVRAREAGTFSDVSTITDVSTRKSVNPHSKVCCKYLLYINLTFNKKNLTVGGKPRDAFVQMQWRG